MLWPVVMSLLGADHLAMEGITPMTSRSGPAQNLMNLAFKSSRVKAGLESKQFEVPNKQD
jgi:hypothetical protein